MLVVVSFMFSIFGWAIAISAWYIAALVSTRIGKPTTTAIQMSMLCVFYSMFLSFGFLYWQMSLGYMLSLRHLVAVVIFAVVATIGGAYSENRTS